MTGFGRGSASCTGRIINVEIKALNSKQLDLIIKLPARYRFFEGEFRNLIASRAERGKIEGVISTEQTGVDAVSPFNTELLKFYKHQIELIDAELGIDHPSDWHGVLMRMPDVMKTENQEIGESEQAALTEASMKALDNMLTFRMDEGRKLYRFFREKIENISGLLRDVEPFEESRVEKIKARIHDQLEKLSGVDIDNGRLEQEMIYYIEKLDISEEKQRLAAHLDYFLNTMDGAGNDDFSPKGKKLGFIAQEMGREINTLGSKSNNADMQIIVVKMKDELEQIKEQVLNVL